MALSDSRRKANDKYIAEHYARVALSMPKEEAAALDDYCKRHNLSKAGFIRQLIKAAISEESTRIGAPGGCFRRPVDGRVTPTNSREEEKG